MVGRNPRQIIGFDVAVDKSPERIQSIVDNSPDAECYCSDGWRGIVKYTQNSIVAGILSCIVNSR